MKPERCERSSTEVLGKTPSVRGSLTQPSTALSKMAESDDITDLVEQFMTVTGVEDTVAMCYLQQSGWDLQVSGHLSLYIAK